MSDRKKKDVLELRAQLRGKLIDEFFYIKDRMRLENNSEVLRSLIRDEYQRRAGSQA